MADKPRRGDAERRKKEEARRAEEDRIAAEMEFLEKHEKERKLFLKPRPPLGAVGGNQSATSSQAESESEAEQPKRPRSKGSPEEMEQKSKSRKTDEESGRDEEEFEDSEDPLMNLAAVLLKMRGWFRQPTIMKMVTKPQTEKFGRYLNRFEEELVKAREGRSRVEERESLVRIVRDTVREELRKSTVEDAPRRGISYAEVAARKDPVVPKVTGVKGPVLPAPKLVIVRHQDKESEEVKSLMKSLVKPQEIGLKVRRVKNIRNGVVVEAENEEGAENLVKQKALVEAGLKVEIPSKKRPFIMIYDVSADMGDESVSEEVFARNMDGSGVELSEFKDEFQVRHKYKDRKGTGNRNHVVVECSVRVRNWLRRQEKIFVEWQCCRVKDYVDVARCYKCQKFGHIAKYCNSAKPSCSYCAGDHEYKDCANKRKRDAACCVNCKREERSEFRHEASWKKCPAYDKAVKRSFEKIDYGV